MRWTRYSVWIRLELYVPRYNYQWIFSNKIIIKSKKKNPTWNYQNIITQTPVKIKYY